MSFFERTYGEITDLDFMNQEINNIILLNHINIQDYIFYDFGSGYGKIIQFFSQFYKKSIGIEIDKERYTKSLMYSNNICEFYNMNFFDVNIESSCVILINNLCLGVGTNKRLSYKLLEECKKYDIIILTKQMPALQKYYLYFKTVKCTWGPSELYFYLIT